MELRYRTALVLVLASWATAARVVQGQIFVGSFSGGPQDLSGSLGEYNLDGSVINPALVPGTPIDVAIAGSSMYVLNTGGEFRSTISRYTTGGVLLPMKTAPPFYIMGSLAVSASNLYVAYASNTGRVGKCTLDGTLVDDSFISGLHSLSYGIALSPDQTKLFVADGNAIGEYDAATGMAINAALISGLNTPTGITIAGSHLYVANAGAGTIGEYNLDGTVINAALVSGLSDGFQLGHVAALSVAPVVASYSPITPRPLSAINRLFPSTASILASLCMHLGSRSLLVAALSLKTDCCRFMTDQVVRETFLDQLWEARRPLRGQRRIARSILSH